MDIMKNFREILREQYDALEEEEQSRAGKKYEKPSDGIYDDASWHYKQGILKKVPKEMGATHIGFFLRWCRERDLLSPALLEKLAKDRALYEDEPERWSYRTFVIQRMGGVFSRKDLTEEGQAFADVYYTGKKTAFSQEGGSFLENYEKLVNVLYRLNGRDYFRVKEIEANYEKVRAMLDERYGQFLGDTPPEEQETEKE